MSNDVSAKIQEQIKSSPVFLYMKGTPEAPACGFSHEVIMALNQLKVSFNSFNVLEDWDIREGIKTHANWPFIPQLYINGEFVGGRDIVMAMHKKGELEQAIKTTIS